jgi:hypothetical protein
LQTPFSLTVISKYLRIRALLFVFPKTFGVVELYTLLVIADKKYIGMFWFEGVCRGGSFKQEEDPTAIWMS